MDKSLPAKLPWSLEHPERAFHGWQNTRTNPGTSQHERLWTSRRDRGHCRCDPLSCKRRIAVGYGTNHPFCYRWLLLSDARNGVQFRHIQAEFRFNMLPDILTQCSPSV